ncbi:MULTISPECIES: hypothetical protein [Nocardia]|uniref:Uncharacterized protein n=1 Tax=Nocardia sputorum TaxID=2984338 RepID=A0ABM8CZ99_9NOCA|nr:hypothetical protein [Nocardia sputorum]BDT91812.1 hypothetical protein IFM12275_17880 [Nocardia sputorum]BDU00341.1 hypothetical protein IFM12276_33690 [Nocardia sputorum]
MSIADAEPIDVVAVSRSVVAEHAPEELPLFDATAAAYAARRRGPSPDELLGFGVGAVEAVVTVAVLAATKGAVDALLEYSGKRTARGLRSRLPWRRRREAVPSEPLTAEQLNTTRDAARRAILAYGMTDQQANLLAGAIIGELAAPEDPPR